MKCEHCDEPIRRSGHAFEHRGTGSAFCWVGTSPQPAGVSTHQSTAAPATEADDD
jgi:hypothetical protein